MENYAFAIQAQFKSKCRSLFGFEILARDARNPLINTAQSLMNEVKNKSDFLSLDKCSLLAGLSLKKILDENKVPYEVSVNVELSSLKNKLYLECLFSHSPCNITLEITERESLFDSIETLKKIKKIDPTIKFSLDDFLTYSHSIDLLQFTDFDQIKILNTDYENPGFSESQNFICIMEYCQKRKSSLVLERVKNLTNAEVIAKSVKNTVLQGFKLHEPVFIGRTPDREILLKVIAELENA